MKLWIARDENGTLFLYYNKPVREMGSYDRDVFSRGYFYGKTYNRMCLEDDDFLEITWENSPQEVELISKDEYKHLKEIEEIYKEEGCLW